MLACMTLGNSLTFSFLLSLFIYSFIYWRQVAYAPYHMSGDPEQCWDFGSLLLHVGFFTHWATLVAHVHPFCNSGFLCVKWKCCYLILIAAARISGWFGADALKSTSCWTVESMVLACSGNLFISSHAVDYILHTFIDCVLCREASVHLPCHSTSSNWSS